MKTSTLNFRNFKTLIICGLLTVLSLNLNAQSNCIVNPINGPSIITGAGTINQLFYVTSNGQHIWTLPAGASLVSYGANGNDSIIIAFAPSYVTGTIKVRRNGPSCVNTIQSKVVTRNSCNLSVNAGNDTKVYYGYSPMSCATLNATTANGTAPFNYLWSNGQTGQSISVCPSSSQTYSVTVTDAAGCVASDEVFVCAVDVRCSAGKSSIMKVEVCHKNNKTICISASAVPAHLNNGGSLGSCSEQNSCAAAANTTSNQRLAIDGGLSIEEYDNDLEIFPSITSGNINISTRNQSGKVQFEIINITGQVLITDELIDETQSVDVSKLSSGIYYVRLLNSDSDTRKFIKE